MNRLSVPASPSQPSHRKEAVDRETGQAEKSAAIEIQLSKALWSAAVVPDGENDREQSTADMDLHHRKPAEMIE